MHKDKVKTVYGMRIERIVYSSAQNLCNVEINFRSIPFSFFFFFFLKHRECIARHALCKWFGKWFYCVVCVDEDPKTKLRSRNRQNQFLYACGMLRVQVVTIHVRARLLSTQWKSTVGFNIFLIQKIC